MPVNERTNLRRSLDELKKELLAGESILAFYNKNDMPSDKFINLTLAKNRIDHSIQLLEKIQKNLQEQPEQLTSIQKDFEEMKTELDAVQENLSPLQSKPIKGWLELFLNTISKLLCCFGEYKSKATEQRENINSNIKQVSEIIAKTTSVISSCSFFKEERYQARADEDEKIQQQKMHNPD